MKILVTGGLGYIGSHVVVRLQEVGYAVIIIDNLSNSSMSVLDSISDITGIRPQFNQIDVRDRSALVDFFSKELEIDGVIHFAAAKAVGESVHDPLKYYDNNVAGLVNLLSQIEHRKMRLIFSSSCTVYGQPLELPISESAPIQPAQSPYGNTKKIGEEIIQDLCNARPGFSAIALRYFNPIGAHSSLKIGELPIGTPQNLVPFITQTAIGLRDELSVFGDDWSTRDGTAIRDYIHVVDLADAHVVAMNRLVEASSPRDRFEQFNIGTGVGSTVMEVITAFELVSGLKLKYKKVARRQGDIQEAWAQTLKSKQVLGWSPKLTLADAMASAWAWEVAQI